MNDDIKVATEKVDRKLKIIRLISVNIVFFSGSGLDSFGSKEPDGTILNGFSFFLPVNSIAGFSFLSGNHVKADDDADSVSVP
jgi:hypothetical protein